MSFLYDPSSALLGPNILLNRGVKLTTHLHLVPRSKNEWSYTSTPQYALMAWCSVKAQGQLYFTLLYFNPPQHSILKNPHSYAPFIQNKSHAKGPAHCNGPKQYKLNTEFQVVKRHSLGLLLCCVSATKAQLFLPPGRNSKSGPCRK
jgi:hypothetical protein